MFAWLFATGTATTDSKRCEGNANLVECTALTFPPQNLLIYSQIFPVLRIAEFLPSRSRTGIGSHCRDLIRGEL